MPASANNADCGSLAVTSNDQVVVLIPCFNEEARVGSVAGEVLAMGYKVLVVDDGSTDDTARVAREAGAEVLSHAENLGKGAALSNGYERARALGCKVLITMDGDGQHLASDIPTFVEAFNRTKIPVIVGNRLLNEERMPFVRKSINLFMSWMLCRRMRQYVPDTQCGFRLFRCDVLPYVTTQTIHFEAESEILLHIASRRIQIGWVRVSTVYGEERSKIKPVRDTIRFFRMLIHYSKRRKHPQ